MATRKTKAPAITLKRREVVTRILDRRGDAAVVTGIGNAVHDVASCGDDARNMYLAGIMGGAGSEIRPETSNVLLEAAAWNFINIRQSSRQHALLTDAAFRFSRGVHPSQALIGALTGERRPDPAKLADEIWAFMAAALRLPAGSQIVTPKAARRGRGRA